jgi:hypothetical protein
VIDRNGERAARDRLPADARHVMLDGVTHAQFGAYGPQEGDGTPTRSDGAARRLIGCTVVNWLGDRGGLDGSGSDRSDAPACPPPDRTGASTARTQRRAIGYRRGPAG